MTIFDKLERRFGWLAFPGFLRFYALMHVMVFVLQYLRPDLHSLLEFDRAKILSGEVWRVVSMFFAVSAFGMPSLVALVFLYFAVNFFFMVNDGLEGAWGAFKTSLFFYMGMVLILGGSFLFPWHLPQSGLMLYTSALLAFATMFPKVEILLFMVLPVQVRFIGMLAAAGLVLGVIADPATLPFVVLAVANYLVFAAIPIMRGRARILESVERRRSFKAAKLPASEAFHTCAKCGRTDVSDPRLEFRVGDDGQEYCADHLGGDVR